MKDKMNFIRQNWEKTPVYQNGKLVKHGFIYGRAYGLDFICRPVTDEKMQQFSMFVHDCTGYAEGFYNPWRKEINAKIRALIVKEAKAKRIRLFPLDEKADNERMKKAKLDKQASRAFYGEKSVRRHHCKVSRSAQIPKQEFDYQSTSRKLYGETIEIERKTCFVGQKIGEYMDGDGSGLRPLDTGCFIGSGRKVRFAKAPL